MIGRIFFLVLIFQSAVGQILIKDQDRNPITDVHIYLKSNPGNTIVSDEKGSFTLPETWKENEMVIFSHLLYEKLEIPVYQVKTTPIITLQEDNSLLEEIIVSVNVNEDILKQRAEKRILISQREIEKLSPATSADLLSRQSGVSLQKSQSGGGSPNIRGFEANRILLMVDGVRMNNAIYRGGHLQNAITIDPSILANSEVLFGPSSVAYGSDAMGGVVHFKTKNPNLVSKPNINISQSFISGSKSYITHIDGEYSFGKLALLTSVTRSDFGDIKMGKWRAHGHENWGLVPSYMENGYEKKNDDPNIQKRTSYDQIDFLQKAIYYFNDDQKWINNFQYSNSSNINRFDQLNDLSGKKLKFTDWYYGPQKRVFFSSSFEDVTDRKFADFIQVIGAYQDIQESRHKWKNGADHRTNGSEDVDVYSINANFAKNSWGYGLEAISNKINSSAENFFFENDTIVETNATRYPSENSGMYQGAAYIKKEHSFSDKLKANAGVRATYTETYGKYNFGKDQVLPEDSFTHVSKDINWNISVVYHPNESTKLSGIISTGFHSPNVDDITKFSEKGSNLVVPNLDLKTEYSRNFEINISKDFNKKHLINMDVYYSHLINPIVKVDEYQWPYDFVPGAGGTGTALQSNINEKKGYIFGTTFYYTAKWSKHWQTTLDVTYTRGKITERAKGYSNEGGEILAHIPPVFGKIKVNNFVNDKFSHQLACIFNSKKSKEEYDVAGVDNLDESPRNEFGDYVGTPAWFSLDYQMQWKYNKLLTLQAGMSNILDMHYKTYGSGISAMGRSVNLTLRAKI
jgi:hemoglobin/transferrin/lactoferrin receptor protein